MWEFYSSTTIAIALPPIRPWWMSSPIYAFIIARHQTYSWELAKESSKGLKCFETNTERLSLKSQGMLENLKNKSSSSVKHVDSFILRAYTFNWRRVGDFKHDTMLLKMYVLWSLVFVEVRDYSHSRIMKIHGYLRLSLKTLFIPYINYILWCIIKIQNHLIYSWPRNIMLR